MISKNLPEFSDAQIDAVLATSARTLSLHSPISGRFSVDRTADEQLQQVLDSQWARFFVSSFVVDRAGRRPTYWHDYPRCDWSHGRLLSFQLLRQVSCIVLSLHFFWAASFSLTSLIPSEILSSDHHIRTIAMCQTTAPSLAVPRLTSKDLANLAAKTFSSLQDASPVSISWLFYMFPEQAIAPLPRSTRCTIPKSRCSDGATTRRQQQQKRSRLPVHLYASQSISAVEQWRLHRL